MKLRRVTSGPLGPRSPFPPSSAPEWSGEGFSKSSLNIEYLRDAVAPLSREGPAATATSTRPPREGRYLSIFDMKAAAARPRRTAAWEVRRAAGAAAIAAEALSASRLVMSPRATPAGSGFVLIRRPAFHALVSGLQRAAGQGRRGDGPPGRRRSAARPAGGRKRACAASRGIPSGMQCRNRNDADYTAGYWRLSRMMHPLRGVSRSGGGTFGGAFPHAAPRRPPRPGRARGAARGRPAASRRPISSRIAPSGPRRAS